MNPQHLNYNHNQATFHQEKQKWENAISNYQGPDPLELWYEFICWYEQNIQLDHERLFETVLGKCLSIYETQQHYKQDTRMVKLWMKYIGLKNNPLQLYQVLYQRGIGTQCSIFYIGWAHYYDSANAFKQAESVYNLGFQANAQPYSALERSHKDFRFSLSQRMLYNDQQSKKRTVSQLNDQRQQLTSLNPSSSSPNVPNFQHAQNNYTPPPPMNQQQQQQQNSYTPPPPPPTAPSTQQQQVHHQQPQQISSSQQQQQPYQSPQQQQTVLQQPPVQQQQTVQQQSQPYQSPQPMPTYQGYNSPAEEQQPPAKKFRGQEEQRTYNNYNNYQPATQPATQIDYNRENVNGTEYNNQYAEPKTNSDELNSSTSAACALALNSVYSDEDGSEDFGAYRSYNEATSNVAETTKYPDETLTYSRTNNASVVEQNSQPGGCILSPNFARFAKNHHDPWSWPIFLDEPDTNKVCKYPRHLVYPGNGCEYSLEEIRARNYTKVIETIKERNRLREIALNEQRQMNQMQNVHQQQRFENHPQHQRYGEQLQQQHQLQQQQPNYQQQQQQQQHIMRQQQQQQYEQQQAYEKQRMAEMERERVMKERERSRLAALEMQRAKEHEEQQRRLAEQQKMQQMQGQASFVHQQPNRGHAQPSPLPPHSVNNHSGYYEQNQSPVYSNYVNYPAPNHQNSAPVQYPLQAMQSMQSIQQVQQPPVQQVQQQQQQQQQQYYNQNHMAPQTSMHSQPQPTPPVNHQNDMYQSQQPRYLPQAMPPQHHQNMMPATPSMQMQYQDTSYQSQPQSQYAPQNHEYQYPMQPTATAVPVSNSNSNYSAQPLDEEGPTVTELKTVNCFADDIEEQIEASTIVLKNGSDKLQKITIKYRKEKAEGEIQPVPPSVTTPRSRRSKKPKSGDKSRTAIKSSLDSESENSTFMNNEEFQAESNDSFSTPTLTSKLSKSRRTKTKTPKFEPTYLQDDDSCSNSDFNTLYGKYSNEGADATTNEGGRNVRFNFTGATSTPIRNNNNINNYQSPCSSAKPSYKSNESSSKSSTPRNTYKSLRRRTSNISLLNSTLNDNDDSMTSFSMVEPNSFFETESNEELHQQRLDKALKTIDTHFKKDHIDPFNSELCKAFLTKADFPSREHNEFYKLSSNLLSKLSNTRYVTIGDVRFNVEKEIGRGAYGNVYRGVNANTSDVVALKFQKPPNTWELYICYSVHQRIKNRNMLLGFMDISSAIIAPNASIFVSEFSQFGSLLDINNRIRQSTTKVMHESLVMHFTSQILNIVHYLHSCKIIHGDIKPDNFLLMKVPNPNSDVPTLRLIDFGCAIDMKFFEPNTQFKKVIQTDGFTCPEMLEGRQWSYQTDVFCVAGTVHAMLFGEYMQMVKKFGQYEIKQKLPRYLKKHIWTEFFSAFLNIKDVHSLPNLLEIKEKIDHELESMESELQSQIRTLSNILYKR